jgi:hypothetical protein
VMTAGKTAIVVFPWERNKNRKKENEETPKLDVKLLYTTEGFSPSNIVRWRNW